MARHEPPPAAACRRSIVAALLFSGATVIGVVADEWVAPPPASSPAAASPSQAPGSDHHPSRDQAGQGRRHRMRTESTSPAPSMSGGTKGVVQRGSTTFDSDRPAVANLDPALIGALRRAATAAARGGVALRITSGWRSPAYQERLLRQAVSTYGSKENAARWVATADTSAHVSGHAVDVGPSRAAAWLSAHGAAYGLCQIYRNEPWHYELRPAAIDRGCPPMYPDPTHDPRMTP